MSKNCQTYNTKRICSLSLNGNSGIEGKIPSFVIKNDITAASKEGIAK
jgi:hypothetical protein